VLVGIVGGMEDKLTAELLDELEHELTKWSGEVSLPVPTVLSLIAAARASLESRGDAGTPTYVCDGSYGMSHSYPSCGWKSERSPAGGHCPVCRGCVAVKMLPLASAAVAEPLASPALAAEARASAPESRGELLREARSSVALDRETYCLPEESRRHK
jgi:hypothetical protein